MSPTAQKDATQAGFQDDDLGLSAFALDRLVYQVMGQHHRLHPVRKVECFNFGLGG